MSAERFEGFLSISVRFAFCCCSMTAWNGIRAIPLVDAKGSLKIAQVSMYSIHLNPLCRGQRYARNPACQGSTTDLSADGIRTILFVEAAKWDPGHF